MFTCRHEGSRATVVTDSEAIARAYLSQGWSVSPLPKAEEAPAPAPEPDPAPLFDQDPPKYKRRRG